MQNLLHGLTSSLRIRVAIPSKPRVPEEMIAERKLGVERKTFFFCVKENHKGRFCRITEEAGERRNTIIIPASGLPEFVEVMAELAAAAKEAESAREGLEKLDSPC